MTENNSELGWKPSIAKWLWSRRDEIGRKLSEVAAWFKRGGGEDEKEKPGILMLGSGGVGKTTLAKMLAGEYDFLLDTPGPYEESLGVERYLIEETDDAPEVEIVVPPGQKHRRESSWNDLFADVTQGKFRGIILFASYGYHSLGEISYKQHRLYAGKKKQFLDALLEDQRKDELAVLRQLAPYLKTAQGKLWLLNVVTKQDLWWPQRQDVEGHYQKGEYWNVIQQVMQNQDSRRFRHEVAFVSLVIGNFVTGKGEELQKNTAGYDQALQVASLQRLFEMVGELKDWEAGP